MEQLLRPLLATQVVSTRPGLCFPSPGIYLWVETVGDPKHISHETPTTHSKHSFRYLLFSCASCPFHLATWQQKLPPYMCAQRSVTAISYFRVYSTQSHEFEISNRRTSTPSASPAGMAGTKRTQREESTTCDLANNDVNFILQADSYLRRIRTTFRSNLVQCLFQETNGLRGSVGTPSASADRSISISEKEGQVRCASRHITVRQFEEPGEDSCEFRIRNIRDS